jgi:hypothetical protein
MSLILGIPMAGIEKVIYFAGYIVISVDEAKKKEFKEKIDAEYKQKAESLEDEESIDKLKQVFKKVKTDIDSIAKGAILDELSHQKYTKKFAGLYEAAIGSEAIYNLMKEVDTVKLEKELDKALEKAPALEKTKLRKRITLVKSLNKSKVKPE